MSQSQIAGTPITDFTIYEEESIHAPGYIQPHGILFALQEPELTILQVSNNTFDLFGIYARALLGKTLDKLLDEDQVIYLKEILTQENMALLSFW